MSKTHYKKLMNPDYLGAYAIDEGNEPVLTIKTVGREEVTGTDGKKETCIVAHFHESVKPMILNATNCKTIAKITGSKYIEDWVNRRIQIYVAPVRAFGEMHEALRIRPKEPAPVNAPKPKLTPSHEKWEAAAKALADSSTTIESIRKSYELSESDKQLLIEKAASYEK